MLHRLDVLRWREQENLMLHPWKVSEGGPGFAGVGLRYFKIASKERRRVYVTIGCYLILMKKLLMVKPSQ